MPHRLPMITIRRALIPGTTMIVPAPSVAVGGGDRIVVVYTDPASGPSTVGTESIVAEVSEGDDPQLRVTGVRLVTVGTAESDRAEVEPVHNGDVPDGLVAAVGSAVRRFMAVRAEAGLGGDVHFEIAPNPEIASHQVASLLNVSWPEIQEIFEAGDAAARLGRALSVLERETMLLVATMGKRG